MFGRIIQVKNTKDHAVFNTMIQGSAADVLKLGLIKVDKYFNSNLETINSIHDSSYEENLPEEAIPEYIKNIEDFDLPVPIKVDVKRSTRSWADMEEVLIV